MLALVSILSQRLTNEKNIPLYMVKYLSIEDVLYLINEQTDLYSTIKKHKGYFTLYGSYMFEFPVYGQYSFAEVQKLWNDRDNRLN